MRQNEENIYKYYNQFLSEFILKGNSILTSDTGILTPETIKNCFTNYIVNFREGGDSFDDKITEQFKNADKSTRLVFAHAEWLWAFAVDDITQRTKKEITKFITLIKEDSLLNNVYPKGFGHAGTYHKNNKYLEIRFTLILIRFLKDKTDKGDLKTADEANKWVEMICLFHKYEQEFPEYQIPESLKSDLPEKNLAMCNILTHVAFPDKYERIASDDHKNKILDSFSGLLSEAEINDETKKTDEKIFLIRTKLGELTGNKNFDFYIEEYERVWNYSITEKGFSEMQGLQYKKAIILYGPPGTSKTHTARRLANALIAKAYLSKKENVVKYFKKEEKFEDGRIHNLQLHPNYNYEDFVAGIQLKNDGTEVVKGKLFDICEASGKDIVQKMPHVLILDEINRIDLSRLFGEVFSAMENRGETIEIGVGNLKLTIPENLYVIGTMNEIDFSLERIDFALRRRFLWFFYGFNRITLSKIIWHKNNELKTLLKDEEVERFINNAQALNDSITQMPELGEQYQIGHTFFGEIVNIFKSYKDLNSYSRLQKQLYRKDGPAQILWDISIDPIINAFLGNMDKEARKEKISELKNIYFK